MCPLFQTEAGRTLSLSLFRLSSLNRIAVLDSLSISETKCWLSYSKLVVIKGPSSLTILKWMILLGIVGGVRQRRHQKAG